MINWFSRLNITGLNTTAYLQQYANNVTGLPNIGIAASGGGYRALMNGAGNLAAFDNRTPNSTAKGQLGGLLQSTTYLAGLSGGSWLIGSLYSNNFTSVQNIIDAHSEVWDFTNSILEGPNQGFQLLTSVEYYTDLYENVNGKDNAGYDTSLTDYWGRALSYQLINATQGGPGYTWSSVAQDPEFAAANAPFPILIADGRAPGQVAIPANTTIFEFNPFEMGSWDPTLYGFAPMRYVGSNFSAGVLPDNAQCIAGFDNAGFVMGTSSTLFNQIVLQFNSTVSLPTIVENGIQNALNKFGASNNDIADWYPNPFYNYLPGYNVEAPTDHLYIVDGGEDGENIPIHPLIQPVRDVDVIIAIDSSADTTYNWPNGTSLVATYERSLNSSIQNKTAFPIIPDQNTFVNLGLNTRPTFFGCNATNSTNANAASPGPLIVYLPNTYYTAASNVSTYNLSYTIAQRNSIITNAYNSATRGNGSVDAMWPTCLGCAILKRSLERSGTAMPAACTTCFNEYCWNGTTNATTPKNFNPTPVLGGVAAAAATTTAKSAAVGGLIPRVAAVGAAVFAAAAWVLV